MSDKPPPIAVTAAEMPPRNRPSNYPADLVDKIGAREKTVLAAGRLNYVKRFDKLIRIFASVHEKMPDWKLKIVGEGEERPALERLIRELGAQDCLVEGKVGSDIRADVFFALAKANLPLLHTYGGELSLEDVFLHLTGHDGAKEAAQ